MKILDESNSPLDIFCKASSILNKAVIHTLGPFGTNTAVQNNEHYEIINDGKSIIEKITSLDPALAPALETLKQASFETNRKAGDGTTSTTVMMNSLLQGAKKYLESTNITPTELRNELYIIKNLLIDNIRKFKTDLNPKDYNLVAEVALGNSKYAELIADVFKFLDIGKRPILIKSDISDVEVEKIDGVNLTKSKIVSTLFLETKEYINLDVICIFEPINRFQEITQLLRKVQQNDKITILFYNQLSADILENILFNYTNGAIKLIPICINGYGKGTYSVMQDIANYTDCNIIDNTTCKISELNKIKIGHIDRAIVNQDAVTIKNNDKQFDNNLYLDDKTAIIHVGGTNKIEQEETYKRIEDSVNSLGNAIEFGVVEGAGMTYVNLAKSLDLEYQIPSFVLDSLNIIHKQINLNSNKTYDSALVIKEVIKNSFSIVEQVITTNALIHENIR